MPLVTVVLACCAAALLSGCFVEEDTISIGADATIKFTSVVTIADPDEKMAFADVESTANGVLEELRQKNWQIRDTWVSKERPYQLKVSGSGKLADVTGGTRLYSLLAVDASLYRLRFESPGKDNQRRIRFEPMGPDGRTGVYTAGGDRVVQIDQIDPAAVYSIVIPPAPKPAE